jgi:starch phosphorylase
VKRANKQALAAWCERSQGIRLDPELLFDCHVKRIHEYKRQLLNALHVIALLNRLRNGEDIAPRAVLFAGKAAPGYFLAKRIIKLIHAIAEEVLREPAARGRLQVAFLPNYSVSMAERIFPACELSEQISTAGSEASGTGNMKAALNGALTIGTLDGANVEIREEVGPENVFIFGLTSEEVAAVRAGGYDPRSFVSRDPELAGVIRTIEDVLDGVAPGLHRPILDALLVEDRYLHCADFAPYVACQRRAAEAYARPEEWTRMSILNVAGMGKFSSDRTTREYADEIWRVAPVAVPPPGRGSEKSPGR